MLFQVTQSDNGNSNKRENNLNRSSRRQNSKMSRHQLRRTQPKQYFGCGICQADHSIVDCKKYNQINLAQKNKTAGKSQYCVNCLNRNHLINTCTSKIR